jgi:prophage DNA circulation protein
MATMLTASFKGVRFEVVSTEDTFGRALIVAEYPGRDGGHVADEGGKPRRVRLSAIFWGPSYQTDLRLLLDALADPGPGDLVHPVWGTLQASAESWTVRQATEPTDEAAVDIAWVEEGFQGGLAWLPQTPAALLQLATVRLGRVTALAPAAPSALAQIRGFLQSVRNFLARVTNSSNLTAVRAATQLLVEVQTTAQSVLDAVRTLQDPNTQPFIRESKRLVRTCNELGAASAGSAPAWTTYVAPCWTMARLIAHELYGNANRAAEIVEANALRDPARIAPGSRLSVRCR